MNSHSARVREIFGDALERPPADRVAFLLKSCGDDPALRQEVERLLADHREFAATLPDTQPAGEHEGDQIGPYRLLERIGEGGFGTVWMAEQQQPIRRKVALKIVKWGMDTRQVVARFKAERQALALMEHPHIARVLDGGATANGRPYFAMELVHGVPITRYCDEAKLTLRQRIELFVPVCEAVQHAHQKGVVHRDLKPSNVLVTLHDGRPVPKVIDFGIAKATAGQLTDKTLFTGFRQMLGTPEYMAPEQAEMSGLDIDTRADIYSLGALLYELLTGTKPFELKEVLAAGWNELLRRIKEVDPDKPSTRVSTLGERTTAIATQRRMLPKALSTACRGDVDWIVLKAMEKERGRRYDTAHAFAEDLLRHLHDEPVLASPPSRWYRWRKYVRRNRLGVAAGAAVLCSLVGGAVAAGWGYWRAEAEATRARESASLAERKATEAMTARAEEQRQTKTSRRVVQLLRGMLTSADPAMQKGPEYRVRDLLADFVREIDASEPDPPEIEHELRRVVGSSYLGLGMLAEADRQLGRALELAVQRHGEDHQSVAGACYELVRLRLDQGRPAEALQLAERALAAIPDDWDDADNLRCNLLGAQGGVFRWTNDLARAIDVGRQAVTLAERKHLRPGLVRQLQQLLACSLQLAGRFTEAEALLRTSLQDPPGSCDWDALVGLTDNLLAQDRLAEAATAAESAVATARRFHGPAHPAVARAFIARAQVQLALGELLAAEQAGRQALEIWRGVGLGQGQLAVQGMTVVATILHERGQLAEAEGLAREALHLSGQGGSPDRIEHARYALGRIQLDKGEFNAATDQFEDALRSARHHRGDVHPWVTRLRLTLAITAERNGDGDQARQYLRSALEGHWGSQRSRAWAQIRLARLLLKAPGATTEAESLLRQVLESALPTPEWRILAAEARIDLAACLAAHGAPEEGERVIRESVAALAASPPGDLRLPNALLVLARIRGQRGDRQQAVALAVKTADLLREPGGGETASPHDLDPQAGARRAGLEAFLGDLLAELGEHSQAAPWLQRARTALRRFPARREEAAILDGRLGKSLYELRRWSEAEEPLRESLAYLHGRSPGHVATNQSWLGRALLNQKRFADAEPILRENVAQWLSLVGEAAPDYAASLANLADAQRELGRFGEAIAGRRHAIAILSSAAGDHEAAVAGQFAALARDQLAAGRCADAERSARESLAIRARRLPDSVAHRKTMCVLGRALAAQARDAEAEPLLVEGCTSLLPDADDDRVREAVTALVELYDRQGRPEDAAPWRARLDAPATRASQPAR